VCGNDQAPLFGRRHTGCGPAVNAIRPFPHFDEHQRRAFLHHKVDFTAFASKIPFQQRQTMQLKMRQRIVLAHPAADLSIGLTAKYVEHSHLALIPAYSRLDPMPVVFASAGGHNPLSTLGSTAAITHSHQIAPMTDSISSSCAALSAASPIMHDVSHQIYPCSTLYVVATPIGNTGDISLRALHLLSIVDAVACEDTRNTTHLLTRYGLSRNLIAAHQHNEREVADKLIARLRAGERIALVSDAGTPAISDPGARIVDAVRNAGLRVIPLPGASAAVCALSASGLLNEHFYFVGFLPAKCKQRDTVLSSLHDIAATLVFYEAPHRIDETVAALSAAFEPSRQIVFARELTKLFEEIHRCRLSEASAWLKEDAHRQKGEFVILLEGAADPSNVDAIEADRILAILLAECSVKQAAALAAQITGKKKNVLYERALEMKKQA
jgi:16S rRNA (cytidine1402-2'-O)-methyltransferase